MRRMAGHLAGLAVREGARRREHGPKSQSCLGVFRKRPSLLLGVYVGSPVTPGAPCADLAPLLVGALLLKAWSGPLSSPVPAVLQAVGKL